MPKTALITGITGQDGSYLAEFLLNRGYTIYGVVRRLSSPNLSRLAGVMGRIELLEGDLTDQSSLTAAIERAQPDEVYNLAAQSFVATSWNQPLLTGDVTGLGLVRLLEAVRAVKRDAQVYQASSSEMFGAAEECPQKETTRFHPRSPYACAKAFAFYTAINYRESYGMFVSNGILFNHESPRRGTEFVTRKITEGVARIRAGLAKELSLGNLDARRDWGYAGDYVEAMWLMLQHSEPDDFVVASGESHSVREFAEMAFAEAGLNWQDHVVIDPRHMRPADVMELQGDATKARTLLGWKPRVSFQELVKTMVQADLAALRVATSAG